MKEINNLKKLLLGIGLMITSALLLGFLSLGKNDGMLVGLGCILGIFGLFLSLIYGLNINTHLKAEFFPEEAAEPEQEEKEK